MNVEFFDRQDERNPLNGSRISETVDLLEQLDRLQGRMPFFSEFLGENGYRILIGIGDQGGCVQYSRTDGRPPYLMAVSPTLLQSADSIEFLIGGTKTPVPTRYYLPRDTVRQIAVHFQMTGECCPTISWEEI